MCVVWVCKRAQTALNALTMPRRFLSLLPCGAPFYLVNGGEPMAKTTEQKQPAIRDKAGRFVKGQSGNPNGRPKKPPELEMYAKDAPAKLRAIADDPDTPLKLKADIEKFFYEAVYGKAPQAIDMNAEVNMQPVIFTGADDIAE